MQNKGSASKNINFEINLNEMARKPKSRSVRKILSPGFRIPLGLENLARFWETNLDLKSSIQT